MISRFIFRCMRWIFILLLAAGVYAYAVEPRWIRLEEVAVPIDSLPDHLDGFTIGVIGDLHLDSTPLATVRRAAEKLAGLNPDVVVVVGDFVGDADLIDSINEALEPLHHPYGVPGNWDRWCEDPEYPSYVDVDMLVNRGISIAPGLWLCGIDDALLGSPSIASALSGAPERAIRILLAHEPDVADWVEPYHRISLQISGHSHGGQVRLPVWGPLLLPPMGEDYPAGLAKAPTHRVYTTRGIGMSHIPMRFLCPPEITLLRLVKE